MEGGIQSSFIPQDAGEVKITPPRIGGGTGFSELVLLLSIVLVVASGVLAGAVFIYEQYMQASLNSKKEQLQSAKDEFDPALIQQLTRLDDRMHAGATILSQHLAPTVLLSALGQATLTTVQYTGMQVDGSDLQHINVKFTGVAQSVNSIALQAQILSKNGVMANPIFSGIARQADGVHFNLSLVVNPRSIGYEQMLSAANPQPTPPPAAQSQSPASPFTGTGAKAPAQTQGQSQAQTQQ